MPFARKVSALAASIALLGCLCLAANNASGAFISGLGWLSTTAIVPELPAFVTSYAPLKLGEESAAVSTIPVSAAVSSTFAALFEQSLSLSWQGTVDATNFVEGTALLEFQVDVTETYRFSGTSESGVGDETHVELRFGDTILAQLGLGIGQPGPVEVTRDVVLLPDQTYVIDFTSRIAEPAEPSTAALAFSLVPVPEPGTATLLGLGIVALLLRAACAGAPASRVGWDPRREDEGLGRCGVLSHAHVGLNSQAG